MPLLLQHSSYLVGEELGWFIKGEFDVSMSYRAHGCHVRIGCHFFSPSLHTSVIPFSNQVASK